jgi:hypothetical protein
MSQDQTTRPTMISAAAAQAMVETVLTFVAPTYREAARAAALAVGVGYEPK